MGGVESPSEDDEAVVDADEKKEVSEEEEADAGDKPANDATADDETEDEIITTVASDEDDLNKFDGAVNAPRADQTIEAVPLIIGDQKYYTGVSVSQEIETGTDPSDPAEINITFEADRDIPANDFSGSFGSNLGYFVGINLPEYDGWSLSLTDPDPTTNVSHVGSNVYYQIKAPGEQKGSIKATYSKTGETDREFIYKLDASACHADAALLVPSSSYAQGLKASTISVSEGQVAENFKIDATVDEPVKTTPSVISMNAVVNAGTITRSKNKSGTDGYWVSLAVPTTKEDGVTATYAIDDDYPISETPAAVNTEVEIGSNTYKTISVNMAEYDNKTAYLWAEYAVSKYGWENTVTYLYKITFDYTKDNGIPSAPEAAIHVLKDDPKGDDQDPGYTVKSSVSGNGTIVVDVGAATAVKPYTVSGPDAGGNGYWVGIAFPGYGTGVSENEALSGTTKYKAGATSDSLSEVTLKKSASAYKSGEKFYDLFYVNLNSLTNGVEYVDVTYESASTSETKTYSYLFDFSDIQLYTGLPTIDQMVQGVEAAPLSASATEAADRAKNYKVSTPEVSGNEITVKVTADDVVKGKVSGNDAAAYYVGVTIPALATADADFTAEYSANTTDEADYTNKKLNAAISSNGVLKTAKNNAGTEGTDATKDVVKQRVAYFDVTTSGKKGYVYVQYKNKKIDSKTVEYTYIVDFSDVTMSNSLPRIDDVKKITFVNSKNNPEGATVDAGFTDPDVSVTGENELTISANNTKAFRYFTVSEDDAPTDSFFDKNDHWVAVAIPGYGKGVSGNEVTEVLKDTKYTVDSISENSGEHYKTNVKIGEKYYDVFYLDASKVNPIYVIKATYTNKETPAAEVSFTYKIDLSKVLYNDDLPDNVEASFIPLKDSTGAVVDPGYSTNADSKDPTEAFKTVSVNNAKAMAPYIISGNSTNGYWVAMAVPAFGTGVSENSAIDTVAYSKDTVSSGNTSRIADATNYKAEDGKYYDLFYLNLANEVDKHFFFKATYTNKNATADSVSYKYEFDFSKFIKDNGIPTLEEVSKVGDYIQIADPVAKNIITEPYEIGDVDIDADADPDTITVSVNAAGLRAAMYEGSKKFWAGIKVKSLSANASKDLPYMVEYSFDGISYSENNNVSSNWIEKNFDIDGGTAEMYVRYTNRAVDTDKVIYKYVLNFTGITKDMKPAGIVEAVTTVALNDKNDDENPYSSNTVTASADTQKDNVITVPVKVNNSNLKYYVEKDAPSLGYGYWTGIALPNSLRTAASTVNYYKGYGEFSTNSLPTFVAADSARDFDSNKAEIGYDNFLYDAEVVKSDHAGKAYVALELAEGTNKTYLVYALDFSGVTLTSPEVDVLVTPDTNKVLYEKGTLGSGATVNVTFTVSKNGVVLDQNTKVKAEIINTIGIGSKATTRKTIAGTDGKVEIPLTIAANPSTVGVVTVNLTVGDNAGGASYTIEVYDAAGLASPKLELDLTDEKEGILNPEYTLASDSQFATSYAIKSYSDPSDEGAIKLNTATGEITALDKTADKIIVSQNIVDKNGKPVDEDGKNTASALTKDYEVTVGASFATAEINVKKDAFYVGKTSTDALELNFSPEKYSPAGSYLWQSTNPTIASVTDLSKATASPVIVGNKAGKATIACTYSDGGKTVTVKKEITVKEPLGAWTLYYNGTKDTSDAEVMPTITELYKSIKLVAKLDAGKKTIPVELSSDAPSIVYANTYSGMITTEGVGNATITATAADGTKKTIVVNVTDDDSVEVSTSPAAVSIKKEGDTAIVIPALTLGYVSSNSTISANSANTSVATVSVSANGWVVIKAATSKKSSTTVNVYYKANGKNHNYTTVNVNVGSDPINVTDIKADITEATIYSVAPNNEYAFAYTVVPANYTDAVFEWSSGDSTIATVDQYGVVTGVKKGTASIILTVTNKDGSKKEKKFTINVKDIPVPKAVDISPKSLTLTAPAGNNSYGGTAQLTAKVSPADATQTVTWSSANKKVADVTAQGLVKATGEGTTTIIASTGSPYYCDSEITVTVIKTVDSSDDAYYANAFDSESGEPQAWMGTLKDEDGNTSFTYTGAAIKPVPNVYYGDMPLVAGTDFTYSYKNNINAAMTKNKPTVTVRLKGNYSGTLTREFEIQPRDIAEATANNVSAVEKVNKKTGAATEQLLKPVITFNGKTLRENKDGNADYKLYYFDNDETAYAAAGTYPITIYGTGNYIGQTTVDEVIIPAANAKNLSKAKIAFTFDKDNQVPNSKGVAEAKKAYYDGGEIVPEVTVTYGGTAKVAGVKLEEGNDYTMTVTNNVNLGKATVTITGIGGGFYGTKKDTFTIVPKVTALNESTDNKLVITVNGEDAIVNSKTVGKKTVAEVTRDDIEVPFRKGGVKPEVAVVYDGKELKLGTDYTVTYKGGKNVGTVATKNAGGSVVINGKGKFFKGSATLNYKVKKGDITEMTYVVDDYVATAKTLANYAKKVSLKAYDLDGKTLALKKDYVIKDIEKLSSPAIGDVVNVTIQGVGNYDKETTVSYRIVDNATIKTLKGAKYAFFDDDNYEVKSNKFYVKYAGTPVVLTKDDLIIRVNKKNGRTTQLEQLGNDDYEILLYENNNKVGTSKITIKGVGDYAGVFTLSYRITNR